MCLKKERESTSLKPTLYQYTPNVPSQKLESRTVECVSGHSQPFYLSVECVSCHPWPFHLSVESILKSMLVCRNPDQLNEVGLTSWNREQGRNFTDGHVLVLAKRPYQKSISLEEGYLFGVIVATFLKKLYTYPFLQIWVLRQTNMLVMQLVSLTADQEHEYFLGHCVQQISTLCVRVSVYLLCTSAMCTNHFLFQRFSKVPCRCGNMQWRRTVAA